MVGLWFDLVDGGVGVSVRRRRREGGREGEEEGGRKRERRRKRSLLMLCGELFKVRLHQINTRSLSAHHVPTVPYSGTQSHDIT